MVSSRIQPPHVLCALLCAAGRAMLASLAAAPLLAKPAFAQEADAVDSAVDNLTSVIKVRTAAVAWAGWQQDAARVRPLRSDQQSKW